MPPYKIANLYRKMVFPISMHQDWGTRLYYLCDKENIIIAENLKEDDARTIKDALIHVGVSLNLLIHILEYEKCMIPHPDTAQDTINERISLIEGVLDFLVDLGIIEKPEIDYKEDFNIWADTLLQQLTKESEPDWVSIMLRET